VLLVTGRSPERGERLQADLAATGAESCTFAVAGEPTVDLVMQGLAAARRERCDVVVAVGGGSVIDTGKAIAGLLTNSGDITDYLEVVGKGKPLEHPAVPFIAVPTTAGTGAEVARNAVLGVRSGTHEVKVSLRSPFLLARLAVVDPHLTLGLPQAVTARTGLDALTQLIEAYVSIRANPVTDGFCVQGISLAARSLRRVFHHGDDARARADMALAALFSGMALANAGLGVVHGFAAPLGGRFHAPHGAICAAILRYGMEMNLRALRERDPESVALRRYEEVARMLTGRPGATAEDGISWVRDICREFAIPPLAVYGISERDVPGLVEESARTNSMKGNPVGLTAAELGEVLGRALSFPPG
jgi:alcohol dehydrogenase class IV